MAALAALAALAATPQVMLVVVDEKALGSIST